MKPLVFDFPGVTSQHYDQLCCSLNHGAPLSTLAEFRRAGHQVVAHIAGPTPEGGWRVVDVWESDEALQRFRNEPGPGRWA